MAREASGKPGAIDVALVQRLVASQFPHWAALPVRAVASQGSDKALIVLANLLGTNPGAPDAQTRVISGLINDDIDSA